MRKGYQRPHFVYQLLPMYWRNTKLSPHAQHIHLGPLLLDFVAYNGEVAFREGSTICLEAVPASSYLFGHSSGDLSGSTNPNIMVIDCNKKVTANFSQVKHNLWLFGGIMVGVVVVGLIIWFVIRSRIA